MRSEPGTAAAQTKKRQGHDLHAPILPTDHCRGALQPRITIIEYGDFASPACRAAEPAVADRSADNEEVARPRAATEHRPAGRRPAHDRRREGRGPDVPTVSPPRRATP